MTTQRPRVRVRVDEENGCEDCWTIFRKMEPRNPLGGVNDDTWVGSISPETWRLLRRCPHAAPQYAPSIFLEEA